MDWNSINSIAIEYLAFISTSTLVLIIIGVLGNIISIAIFKSTEYKKLPETVYLIASCVMNIITILYLPIMYLSPIWIMTSITCKLYPGAFNLIIKIQAWIVAIGSFDRMVTTVKPHSFKWKNNLKIQLISIFTILIIIGLESFPVVYYLDPFTNPKNNITSCTYPAALKLSWIIDYYKYEYLVFRVVLPFFIMLISSIIITWKMCRMKNQLRPNSNKQKEKNLFKSLLALDLFFILFRVPMLVYVIINNNSQTFFNSLTYAILLTVGLISNAFFFLIMIITNKLYRKILRGMLTCKKSS
jgi:hypothetical protein